VLKIVKATPEDFDRVYPLLMEFNNPRIKLMDWKRIFHHPWEVEEDYCGYMLLDNDKVEGYLGYIFSRNTICGNIVKFCNLTSWIVHEKHRGQSLELFYPSIKLEDYVITDFSPTDSVLKMFHKRYKFNILENEMSFVYPSPSLSTCSCNISYDGGLRKDALDKKDSCIYYDHLSLDCRHILMESDKGYCYIVGKNRRFRKFRHMEVIYISNPALLASCSVPVIRAICLRYLVFGLMIENRLLRGYRLPLSRITKPLKTKIYKTGMNIDPADITHLYSEKVLL